MLIETIERNPELMKTIVLPKNLHYLTDVLPKPNYKPLQTKTVDRERYLMSLSPQRSGHHARSVSKSRAEQIKNMFFP